MKRSSPPVSTYDWRSVPFVSLRTVQQNFACEVILPRTGLFTSDASDAAQTSDRPGGSGQ